MWKFLFCVLLGFVVTSCAGTAPRQDRDTTSGEIQALMQATEQGWNAGDLNAYMAGYWRSDTLRFAGGDKVSFGWEQVLANYRKAYPDRETMGQLTFSDLDIQVLAPEVAMVFGRWRLDRISDQPGGLFTLLLRKTANGWRIVHDHTSIGKDK